MKLKKAIKILKHHSKWRRIEISNRPNMKYKTDVVWKAVDTLVDEVDYDIKADELIKAMSKAMSESTESGFRNVTIKCNVPVKGSWLFSEGEWIETK
tara:strand:+ start:455 stop:745 length:291 start_codon:yes stop_codon:yes gene_type:complete